PFELILDLIDKRKLSVNDLSLSQVTDEYIQYVRGQGKFPMEEAAQFIGVAATLLLIKSKSLIPDLELSEEEEGDMDELKRRLFLYERVREARQELSRIFGKQVMVSAGERQPEPVFSPARDLTLDRLESALKDALTALEKEAAALPEARVRPLVTIEEMMDTLRDRVQKAMTLSFSEFSAGAGERIEVIVSFLALLELMKDGVVDALQKESFSDISITNTSTTVPRYG
ncbi:MAG TPA: ScpA family protein, partial [Candidatus Paceibacterota bacterium]|nr:ScpA family protein [Candidatus Paceibacterota bacterium]